ncbi:hypothetical protein ANCDUO_16802 [Ancylostoma duodenale]|uniref:Uncharacterized protein n=1 Tax=Ancylostoma duodenale TaxID=51022 RepID=A0A0C2FWY1_9BILA|nr:hypothetical protein ANCDUO_16802 [Ancylostoma duodenale]
MRQHYSLWFSTLCANVHFEDELDVVQPQQFTMSTATFLRQKGMAWNSLAQTFGCEEDFTKDDAVVMNELLNLCSFWSESEPLFEGVDEHSDDTCESDSDDDLECLRRLAMFSSSVSGSPRASGLHSSSSSGVSSLRINSVLRLNSNSSSSSKSSNENLPINASPYSSQSHGSVRAKSRSNEMEQLENAFKGIVDDDNEVSQDSVYDTATSDDFWSQVELPLVGMKRRRVGGGDEHVNKSEDVQHIEGIDVNSQYKRFDRIKSLWLRRREYEIWEQYMLTVVTNFRVLEFNQKSRFALVIHNV